MLHPLTTQIVGSYCKPEWLLRHKRTSALDDSAWRPDPEVLDMAREDCARLAIYEQERAGLDLVTDGEAQRASYDRHIFARLGGVTVEDPVRVPRTEGAPASRRKEAGLEEVWDLFFTRPRIVGPVHWPGSLCVDELRFLKRHAQRPVKANVVGPLTALERLVDEHYGDEAAAISAIAAALNRELLALQAAGADVLQIDEPSFHFRLDRARRIGVAAVDRMVEGVTVPVVLHLCYGYAFSVESKCASPDYAEAVTLAAACNVAAVSLEYEQPGHGPSLLRSCGNRHVVLGLLDLGTEAVETPEHVADRLRAALAVVPPERLHPASDCGMWHLPREVAFAKIRSLVLGTRILRQEFSLPPPN